MYSLWQGGTSGNDTPVDLMMIRSHMSWTNDGPVPLRHEEVVAIFESIRTRSIADPFFSFLELFE